MMDDLSLADLLKAYLWDKNKPAYVTGTNDPIIRMFDVAMAEIHPTFIIWYPYNGKPVTLNVGVPNFLRRLSILITKAYEQFLKVENSYALAWAKGTKDARGIPT